MAAGSHVPAGQAWQEGCLRLGQAAGTHLQLLYLPSQGGVGSHVLEERGLEADPQVCLLPVAVFLKQDNPTVPHALTSAVNCETSR